MRGGSLGALVLCVALSCGVACAEDATDIEAMNSAWLAYEQSIQSGSRRSQARAAEGALAAGRRVFGAADPELPILLGNYATALIALRKYDDAEPILSEAIEVAGSQYGKRSSEVLDLMVDLADARSNRSYPSNQLLTYKRALSIAAELYGDESIEYADIAMRAAMNTYAYSSSLSGAGYLKTAHKIYLSSDEVDANKVALSYHNLGKFEYSKHNFKRSIRDLLQAIDQADESTAAGVQIQQHSHALLVESYESRGQSDKATEHCIAIGRAREWIPNQDYQPLFRAPPVYPSSALRDNVEGHVDVSFTVDENGFVREPYVLNTDNANDALAAASLDAVRKFRYAPRFQDGKAVAVDNIKTRVSFKLE